MRAILKEGKLHRRSKWSLAVAGICLFLFSTPIFPVQAVTLAYQAEVSAGSVTMAPGEVKPITLKFKNIGSKTWIRGKNATAVYLYGKSSVVGHASWLADDLPALIAQSSVKTGQMASATFSVQAPKAVGTYTERFLLSSAPGAWIKGSVVTVTFKVAVPVSVPTPTPAPVAPAPAPTQSDVQTPVTSGYQAQLAGKGGIEWQVDPGERIVMDVTFKNTGTASWKRTGNSYVSFYTWGPKYRVSAFKDATWKSASQVAILKETEVRPGQIGTIHFELTAPQKEGSYQETFQLAAENAAWISGGSVTLLIRVGNGDGFIATDKPTDSTSGSVTPTTNAGTYRSILLLTSQKSATLPGSERLQVTHGFKNEGTAIWQNRALRLVSVAPSLGTYSSVRDTTWPSTVEAVQLSGTTAPGEIGFISYTLKAPAKRGDYSVTFQLVADGKDVEGGEITIPVTVTSDGAVDPTPIPVPGQIVTPGAPQPLNGDESSLPTEPIIRVGLYKTTDYRMVVRGIQTAMVVTQNGSTVCTVPQGQTVMDIYDRVNRVYQLSGSGCTGQSSSWYVFASADGIAPLEITDYSRPVSWLPGANDNKFRAKLELRYTPATDAVWVINELPIESYLYGIAETSNVSPLEYQKALLTAARTYAMYHVNRGTKHADEYFIVDAHLDQVYRGFGQEDRSPNIVSGAKSTRGQIVTYNGSLAITPYFSRSDGQTRDWTDVWGGKGYPWLKAVPVPWDVGQTLWGHGVGLSARGALYMASKDNATYDQILLHFYTGTELRRAYK